jgi:tRNA threonylcarbamoyladenosine biosynthesis protein TsaB
MSEDPKIVAVETTVRRGGIVLAKGGQVLASQKLAADRDCAADLVPTVSAACGKVGWASEDIEHVYVSIWPGSFTGTRIGVTFAKALALAVGAKVVAVPTFEAISLNALAVLSPPANLVVLMDARGGQVFAEIFRLSSQGRGYEMVRPGELVLLTDLLENLPRPATALGEGVAPHRQALLQAGVILLPEELSAARAEMVHQIGWRMAQGGQFRDVDTLVPVYYRLPTPVERLAAKEKKSGG